MGAVTIEIGGRSYSIACRDGEEAHLRRLAVRVDAKATEARAAVGSVNEGRQLLLAALLLADEIETGGVADVAPDDNATLAMLADRVEAIADALERTALTP